MGSMNTLHQIFLLLVYAIPLLLVLFLPYAKGSRKALWFVVVLFTSWLGFLVYLIVELGGAQRRN